MVLLLIGWKTGLKILKLDIKKCLIKLLVISIEYLDKTLAFISN